MRVYKGKGSNLRDQNGTTLDYEDMEDESGEPIFRNNPPVVYSKVCERGREGKGFHSW